jgi:hypothetical protein
MVSRLLRACPSVSNLWFPQIVAAGMMFVLVGCGTGNQMQNSAASGHFAGMARSATRTAPAATTAVEVSSVTLKPATLVGGASTEATINLNEAAPTGGVVIELGDSDTSVATTPASVTIAAGQTSATVAVKTTKVTSATEVAVIAIYADAVAGAVLTVDPAAATPAFSVALSPATATVDAGYVDSSSVTTKVVDGFDAAVKLAVADVPAGITASVSPATIAAPGSGSATLNLTVGTSVAPGTYSLLVTGTSGSTSHSAKLTLTVPSTTGSVKFQGCWYNANGKRYQGVTISLDEAGAYPFNAILYHGTTCNTNDWADQFGYDTVLNLGGFDYTFWFTDWSNQTDMSAMWYVGNSQSQCVNYETAPNCD